MDEDTDVFEPPDPTVFEALWRPIRASDILDTVLAPPTMLIADLIRSESIVLISGEPFTGKTMFLLAVALSLDTGLPLFDSFIPTPNHKTLFVGQDAPSWDYFGQISALARGYLGKTKMNLNTLCVFNRGLYVNELRKFVTEAVSLYGIDVLMLDVLKSFHTADENSNVEMARIMDLLKLLRDEHRLTIFITHHTSKAYGQKGNGNEITGNYRARGASVIAGSIDQHFLLTRSGNQIQLSMPKMRGVGTTETAVQFQIVQSFNGSTRHLNLVHGARERGQIDSMALANLVEGHLGSLTKSQWTLKELFAAIRTEVSFAHLTDAQLYNRIVSILRAFLTQGKARNPSRGTWSR